MSDSVVNLDTVPDNTGAKLVPVTVNPGTQVHHDGVLFGPGEHVDLPPDLAARWAEDGYIAAD